MALAVQVRDLQLPGADVEARPISFEVEPGEVIGIVGPPGTGKSQLLRMLSGQWPGASARLEFRGVDAQREPRRVWELVGYLRGDRESFLWSMSSRDNLRHHGTMKRLPAARLDGELATHLARVGLAGEAMLSPRSFDRDDRLRLAMAHAWLDDPQLVLLDDPLHGASAEACEQFIATFEEWLEGDSMRTAIIAARSLQPFAELCTRAFMLQGRTLAPVSPRSLP